MLDFREMLTRLGPVALGVMVTLGLMSVASLAVAFERYRTLRLAGQSSRQVMHDAANLLQAGRLREAAARCRSKDARRSHVARTLSAGLEEWLAIVESRRDAAGRDAAVTSVKEAAAQRAALEQSDLRRGLALLATIGSTAPFVGLFGTTFGIIDAFRSISVTGSGGIGAISTGIAEALVTTAFGLFVAVPAVWAYNYFANRVERMGVEMERSGYELATFLGRQTEPAAVAR